jgi:hypothetical protein
LRPSRLLVDAFTIPISINMDDVVVQRCEDLWLNGGDIVIRAENTVFKVFTAILSIASPIFKDMLGVPQPAGIGAELYEGIPFVRLPDSAFDVTQFLKALIYPGCVACLTLTMTLIGLTKYPRQIRRTRALASSRRSRCCPPSWHEV